MEGKISEKGILYIERAGVMKLQGCPYGGDWCGDGCPLFGEPIPEQGTTSAILELCHGKKLFLDKFTDERGKV